MVWRYKDANTYTITRCNADEDNCTIYHTVAGRRRAFQNRPTRVAKSTWHEMKLEAAGNHFVVWFDGTKALDAQSRDADRGREVPRRRAGRDSHIAIDARTYQLIYRPGQRS